MTNDAQWRAARRRLVTETIALNQAIAEARRAELATGVPADTRAATTRYQRALAAERAAWAKLAR